MAFAKKTDEKVTIKPANIVQIVVPIVGTAPFVQNKFSNKAKAQMMLTMSTPKSAKKSKSERPVRDYDQEYLSAQHLMADGSNGIPCVAFRAAMVDACRTVGVVMTKAKMSLFIIPDGFDKDDGTPLVKLEGKHERAESLVRNDNGSADIRIRPMWKKWNAKITIQFDADMIDHSSIVNLLDRAGRQVGVGEGRNFSKNSVGQGWGSFNVVTTKGSKK